MKKAQRPAIDEYFLKIASVVAERATCRRHHVGAVAVKDKHILATGYNGAAAGLKDCLSWAASGTSRVLLPERGMKYAAAFTPSRM
jgi:deoxycytidylate deaminase